MQLGLLLENDGRLTGSWLTDSGCGLDVGCRLSAGTSNRLWGDTTLGRRFCWQSCRLALASSCSSTGIDCTRLLHTSQGLSPQSQRHWSLAWHEALHLKLIIHHLQRRSCQKLTHLKSTLNQAKCCSEVKHKNHRKKEQHFHFKTQKAGTCSTCAMCADLPGYMAIHFCAECAWNCNSAPAHEHM